MQIRSAEELFKDLIELNADQWNIKLAKELSMDINEFKTSFLIRDKLTNISEDRIKLDLYKIQIKEHGEEQKKKDDENYKKAETGKLDDNETVDDVLYTPTTLTKFTIRENSGKKIIESISCTGKIIVGLDFSNAELDLSYFCHCTFYNCNFTEASLAETTFQNCVFNSCPFIKANMSDTVISKTVFIDCNMDNSCFNCAILTDSPIIACQLNFSSLVQATFINSGMIDSESLQSDFTDAKFSSISMVKVNLKDTIFKRARFIDILMTRCDLKGCDLTQVTMTAFTGSRCEYDDKYIELFKMNHFLFSPSVVEWEQNNDKGDI